ncbi:type II and III secretion system protein family protein [Planctomycetota bacterium]
MASDGCVAARARVLAVVFLGMVLLLHGLCLAGAAKPEWPKPAKHGESILVFLGQSEYVEPPWPAKRVAVTDTQVADVQVLSPRHVLIQAKALGRTDLLIWNDKDESIRLTIEVVLDLRSLRADLAKLFPKADLRIVEGDRYIVLGGQVDSVETAVGLRDYLSTRGIQYVDRLRLAGVQQVQLKVRMAEVSRSALRSLAVNFYYAGEKAFFGSQIGGLNPVSFSVEDGKPSLPTEVGGSGGVQLFGGCAESDIQYFIRALKENSYLRLLAEPTLVALSGEEASFLAGGEYPIPVSQGTGVGTAITVEYREYGIRLKFLPTVLGNNMIRLRVAPEVSELSEAGAVVQGGISVPGTIVRRSETTLQMRSGQTFAMAGLLSRTTNTSNSRTLLLGDLPLIGPLFRSVSHRQNEVELLVLVTVSLVEPMTISQWPEAPGDLYRPPNDWELFIVGRLEALALTPATALGAGTFRGTGLERLVGPGAWESWGQGPARSQAPLGLTAFATISSAIDTKDASPEGRPRAAALDRPASGEK